MSVEFGNGASAGTLGLVQLELGTIATPFEFRPYGQELTLCQRYFISFGGNAMYVLLAVFGSAYSATGVLMTYTLPVCMRIVPTLDYSALADLRLSDGNTQYVITGIAALFQNLYQGLLAIDAAGGGLTAYRPYFIHTNNTASARLTYSARL
jgi:hypothetical protein